MGEWDIQLRNVFPEFVADLKNPGIALTRHQTVQCHQINSCFKFIKYYS
jgi:hypothetical protein